jgi:hypothetical protein
MQPSPADPRVLGPTHRRVLAAAAVAHGKYGDVGLRLEGGTALAAYYLRHRESEDLDLFGGGGLHAASFGEALMEAAGRDGLTVAEVSGGEGFAELVIDGVRVHVARTSPFQLEAPIPTAEGVPVASFRDIAAGKHHAVCDRFEVRDFIDLHAILRRGRGDGQPANVDDLRQRAHALVMDLIAVDPGLNPALVGQAIARGSGRPLVGRFPLRLLEWFDETAVQETLHVALDTCARLTREAMNRG